MPYIVIVRPNGAWTAKYRASEDVPYVPVGSGHAPTQDEGEERARNAVEAHKTVIAEDRDWEQNTRRFTLE